MEREFYNEESESNEDENMNEFVHANKQDMLEIIHLELLEQKNNQRLLKQATDIAASEWFWKFRDFKYKFRAIQKIYLKLRKLTVDED